MKDIFAKFHVSKLKFCNFIIARINQYVRGHATNNALKLKRNLNKKIFLIFF